MGDRDTTPADEHESPAERDWRTYAIVDMVDHLEATHHRWLREALVRLDETTADVEEVHAAAVPELHEVRHLVRSLRAELEPHMMKEERVLFPMARALAAADEAVQFHCGSLRNPIGVMMYEHDRTDELLARLRAVTSGFDAPADADASVRALYGGLAELDADTVLHIRKENEVLFPAIIAAEALLSARGS